MLETPFPFLISKKAGKILIFGTFFSEKNYFGQYFTENLHFQVGHVLLRHFDVMTDFHDFGTNGKERPYLILWYQTTIGLLWLVNFKFTGPGRRVTKKEQNKQKKGSRRRGFRIAYSMVS